MTVGSATVSLAPVEGSVSGRDRSSTAGEVQRILAEQLKLSGLNFNPDRGEPLFADSKIVVLHSELLEQPAADCLLY